MQYAERIGTRQERRKMDQVQNIGILTEAWESAFRAENQTPLPPSSVQFSRSVMSDSLQPHESQHSRPACPSPTLGAYKLMSIELVMPLSHLICCRSLLLLPPIPASIRGFSNESTLHIRWPKYWVSASATVLPMNTQDWSLGWTGWISLQSKGLSRVFSNNTVQKHQFFGTQLSL